MQTHSISVSITRERHVAIEAAHANMSQTGPLYPDMFVFVCCVCVCLWVCVCRFVRLGTASLLSEPGGPFINSDKIDLRYTYTHTHAHAV